MRRRRVLAVWLDGFDVELARSLMEQGQLPALAGLASSSARFRLDHGAARATGLAGEHLSTGRSPDDAGRWSAVHFDARSYGTTQRGTSASPFAQELPLRTVVVDMPYFHIRRAPSVRGIVGWGAHDPGAPPGSHPDTLLGEVLERFGPYCAERWIYGVPWPSAAHAEQMGSALTEAALQRAALARWMLTERIPDWDLALVAVSEPHSVLEGLWHGLDPAHPLHGVTSSAAARTGVLSVLAAVDDLVAELATAAPDAAVLVFSLHGMGPNQSDLQSMVLLPELLHRWAVGEPRFHVPDTWVEAGEGVVPFDPEVGWSRTLRSLFPDGAGKARSGVRAKLGRATEEARKRFGSRRDTDRAGATTEVPVKWMPAGWYRSQWPHMRAFAIHSFYDGRIRVNLRGREGRGMVAPSERGAVLDEIEGLLEECTDPFSGRPVMATFERCRPGEGLDVSATEVDAVVTWNGTCSAFDHPRLGRIGPVPYRRSGGHSRSEGMAWVRAEGIDQGDRGWRSSFDVVPTLIDLLGVDPLPQVSGSSLLRDDPLARA